MQNADNVHVPKPAVGGAVYSADYGTAVPTDASTPLGDGINSLGYIHEDGITEGIEGDSESLKAFGGDEVRVVRSEHEVTYTFHPIETNKYALAERYGQDNVTVDDKGNIAVLVNSKQAPVRSYVFEVLLSENMVERTVVPRGQVVEVGERKYSNADPLGSEIKVKALPDESGNKAYKYYAEIEEESA